MTDHSMNCLGFRATEPGEASSLTSNNMTTVLLRKLRTAARLARARVRSRVTRVRCRQRIPEYFSIHGFLSEAEGLALYDLARSIRKEARAVEIGAWQGKSTYCIARGLSAGTLFVIDPFNGKTTGDGESEVLFSRLLQQTDVDLLEQFRENMKRGQVASIIEILRGFSQDFVGRFSQIDLLHIDGDHSIEGCSFDFDRYETHIAPGGYLVFHDYYPDRTELVVAKRLH